MPSIECVAIAPNRTRTFWTTQPDACGTSSECQQDCGRPGLQLVADPKRCGGCSCCGTIPNQSIPCVTHDKTFVTTGWVRSLALNMLLTDARRPDTLCGRRPGSLNGHWSESYIKGDGQTRTSQNGMGIGTNLRYLDPHLTIAQTLQMVKVLLQETLQKLVTYGIALTVTVEAEYKGRQTISASAIITTRFGETANVAVSGVVSGNQWNWS